MQQGSNAEVVQFFEIKSYITPHLKAPVYNNKMPEAQKLKSMKMDVLEENVISYIVFFLTRPSLAEPRSSNW